MKADAFGGASCGFSLTPQAAVHVKRAALVYHDTPAAEKSMLEAVAAAPKCLGTYFSLYKFYFYKSRLSDAERVARRALEVAASQGGFDADWTSLTPDSAAWFRVEGPQHFYLFTLKALAFIRLRSGQTGSALTILAKLFELDPLDSVGASVIRDLAESM
jgi:hypothetical protein